MLRGTLFRVLFLTIVAIALPWPTSAEMRIALVIGNSAYPSGPLSSPKDDAKAIEAKLKALGFQVATKTDLAREGFFNAIRDFGDRLQQPNTVGLFYYSGHGMQVNNRNYMIPTDADIRSDLDVGRFAVPLEDVLVRMEVGKSNPNFVILDACRNNPFEKRFKSSQEGLAQMDAPPSTLIAFAAAPGRVAEAGSGGKLSLYTAALVEHIDQLYPNFISMFQAVQNAVYQRSERTQSPRLELSPGLPEFNFVPVAAAIPPRGDVAKTTETLRELQAKSKQVDLAELRQYRERVQAMEKQVAELRQINQQYARAEERVANLGNETLQGADSRKLERVIAQEKQVSGEIDAPEQQPAGSPSAAELDRLKKQLAELEQTYADLLAIYKSL